MNALGIYDVEVTADAVLAMHKANPSIGANILTKYNCAPIESGRKRIGIAVRSWKDDTAYRQSLADVLSRLSLEQDAEIVFIPMSHPDDTKEAKIIASLMKVKPIVLEGPFTTEEQLSLSGNVDLMIGIRYMHLYLVP